MKYLRVYGWDKYQEPLRNVTKIRTWIRLNVNILSNDKTAKLDTAHFGALVRIWAYFGEMLEKVRFPDDDEDMVGFHCGAAGISEEEFRILLEKGFFSIVELDSAPVPMTAKSVKKKPGKTTRNLDQIKTPSVLMHGATELTASLSESDIMGASQEQLIGFAMSLEATPEIGRAKAGEWARKLAVVFKRNGGHAQLKVIFADMWRQMQPDAYLKGILPWDEVKDPPGWFWAKVKEFL